MTETVGNKAAVLSITLFLILIKLSLFKVDSLIFNVGQCAGFGLFLIIIGMFFCLAGIFGIL